jgi:hypothetical protein
MLIQDDPEELFVVKFQFDLVVSLILESKKLMCQLYLFFIE